MDGEGLQRRCWPREEPPRAVGNLCEEQGTDPRKNMRQAGLASQTKSILRGRQVRKAVGKALESGKREWNKLHTRSNKWSHGGVFLGGLFLLTSILEGTREVKLL